MAEKKVEGQKPFEYNVNDNKNTTFTTNNKTLDVD